MRICVVDIPENALHLTSIASTPTDTDLFIPEGYLTPEDFGPLPEGCTVHVMPTEEVYGCNTIGLPTGRVIVAEGYPTVLATVEAMGLEPLVLDMSEIRAGDGSLTCCSISIQRPDKTNPSEPLSLMPGRGVQIQEDGPTACTQESPSLVKGAGMRSQSVTVRRFNLPPAPSAPHRFPWPS